MVNTYFLSLCQKQLNKQKSQLDIWTRKLGQTISKRVGILKHNFKHE